MKSTVTETQFILSPSVCAEIDRWLLKYPPDQKRSAVVQALFLAQEQNSGWLSAAAMKAVADYLQLPPIEVYEVATFYDMYNLKPQGKNKITICTNIACMLNGADQLVACIKRCLGVGLNEDTLDGNFSIRESECLAACGGAPMCQVNDKEYHENLTAEKMEAIINQLKKAAIDRNTK